MVEDYKRRIAEEKEARKFFMIYEIEFYRQRVANAMQEKNLFDSVSYSMSNNELLAYWRLPAIFSNRQKGILFYLFPVFHKIRGALGYMQEVYRLILQDHITIEQSHRMKTISYNDDGFTLGQTSLAANSIIGKSYPYYYPDIIVRVKPGENKNMYDYLPGAKNIQIINKLNEYFIPLFCESEIKIETVITKWHLNRQEKNESRLGYSVSL